jgi:hypothetical protein
MLNRRIRRLYRPVSMFLCVCVLLASAPESIYARHEQQSFASLPEETPVQDDVVGLSRPELAPAARPESDASGLVEHAHDLFDSPTLVPLDIASPHTKGDSPPMSSLAPEPALADYTIEVFADQPWQDTGIVLEEGRRFEIHYLSGGWTFWEGTIPLLDGRGYGQICEGAYCCEPLPLEPKGSLIGKIGGDVFFIGNQGMFTASESGALSLQMNDCDGGWGDNTGSVTVRVTVSETSTPTFDAAPLFGSAPLTVVFTNTTTGEASGYLWDYGDGSTGNSSALTHTHVYETVGVYNDHTDKVGRG